MKKNKLMGAIKLTPKTTTGSIKSVLEEHKMFKKASALSTAVDVVDGLLTREPPETLMNLPKTQKKPMLTDYLHAQEKQGGMFSPHGIGENTKTEVDGKTPPPANREPLKMNPMTAGLVGGLIGPLGNTLYGGYKDIKNQKYTGIDKLDQIDPGKFSWDRADFYSDRSAAQHLNTQALKDGLKGLLIGGLGGAAAGGLFANQYGDPIKDDALMGGVLGGFGGLVTGMGVGSYRGANNYNEKVIDRLQPEQGNQAHHTQMIKQLIGEMHRRGELG